MASMVARDSSEIFMNPRNRRDSGELDVFEASRYFSGRPETVSLVGATNLPRRPMMEEKERTMWVGGRKSLDMPMKDLLPSQCYNVEKQVKGKKSKQPSSPGGRLASFLNSLFSQTSSKKKSKSSSQSVKDNEEESPGGRRKRRSSISHFRGTGTADTKSLYSSSSSGFRTPPPYAHTPTKVYKDLKSYSDHKQVVPLSKCNGQDRSVTFCPQIKVSCDKREMNLAWIDERIKSIEGLSEKNKISSNGHLEEKIFYTGLSDKSGTVHRERRWLDEISSLKNSRRAEDMDDGGDSDSSSDLFELQNYDLGVYSNGLPVYETTNMESIKRGTPIANSSI
ncbi:protein BIG GRAIN 1-like E [Aristolochia californica]|uniref:protein BIG GRAIN 1-like E n=1 Tax=Aristolochia californica TaxID=171875 RepID=UPI0035E0F2DB